MDHKGVPYAVTLDGQLADPDSAPHRSRGYRCLSCGEYVHVRKGQIRAAHFAHYADRPFSCNTETVLHEAAKLRLRDLIRDGLNAIMVHVPCPGYRSAYDHHVPCDVAHLSERTLDVPQFDATDVEVSFGPYRLDAAAIREGQVVLGLEVHHSHEVDQPKRAALHRARLPWLEVDARTVLELPMPWLARSSSLGAIQCPRCSERAVEALSERKRIERLRRVEEQRLRQATALRKLEGRAIHVAWDGRAFRTPAETTVGDQLTCPACKAHVRTERIEGARVFLHADGSSCDAARAWVLAGMQAIYRQLHSDPSAVKILTRCTGYFGADCRNVITHRLPAFDEVVPEVPSLLLRHEGAIVGQIAFVKRAPATEAPHHWWLKPSSAVKHPEQWWRFRDGSLCPSCSRRLAEHRDRVRRERVATDEDTLEQPRPDAGSKVTELNRRLRRGARERDAQPPADKAVMLEIARRSMVTFDLDPAWVAAQGVAIRICEFCTRRTAYVLTDRLDSVPAHASAALGVGKDDEIRCRCMHCRELGSNNHDRFRVIGAEYAAYVLEGSELAAVKINREGGDNES